MNDDAIEQFLKSGDDEQGQPALRKALKPDAATSTTRNASTSYSNASPNPA